MNIEAYNLDSLRKLVRDLQKENKELRLLLDKAEIPYINSEVFSEIPSESKEYDLDQGARIATQYINEYMVQAQGIEHLVIPRYTRVVGTFSNKEINRCWGQNYN